MKKSITARFNKMVEVFKTDVQDIKQSALLIRKLKEQIPGSRINFDLEDCDKVLRIEGEQIQPESVIMLLNDSGYRCEVLD